MLVALLATFIIIYATIIIIVIIIMLDSKHYSLSALYIISAGTDQDSYGGD